MFTMVDSLQTNPEHRRIYAAIARPGYLVLRLLSYPAWRVRVNGQPITAFPRRDDGLIAVPVPQGEVEVTIDWTTSADVISARWLSVFSVILLTAVFLCELRFNARRLT